MQNDMKTHTINSTYRQFYVADADLDPDAPEEWNDEHIKQRYNALQNIVALCTGGDISARVICMQPGEKYQSELQVEFQVITEIEIESGKLAVYEWPRELMEEYSVTPGIYQIRFTGYNLSAIDSEGDIYVVEFENA